MPTDYHFLIIDRLLQVYQPYLEDMVHDYIITDKPFIKRNSNKLKYNVEMDYIFGCYFWDDDYNLDVETDDYRNFLTTHDEDEVFFVFVNKQEKYGIDAESFRLFGIRKITTMGCTYFSYRLYIIATVTNEELYNRMLKNGIGRKRSYGNGLVSVGADPLEYDDDDILE